jgi:hypothetical protein
MMKSQIATIVLGAVAAVISVVTVNAQTIEPTVGPQASISGIIVSEGRPDLLPMSFLVVPAGTVQPIPYPDSLAYAHDTDMEGNFTVSGLADGEYLIAVGVLGEDFTTTLTDSVTLTDPAQPGPYSFPALRVTVTNGQAVTGVVITLVFGTPELPAQTPQPTSALSPVAELPAAGSGGGPGDTSGYIGTAVAGLALLAFAGGVVWRMRAARR